MSTPGRVELRQFKAMSPVISQTLDFFCSPPSRPVSCILSLFQSRPWPAAWRRPSRGEPPLGQPGCQLSGRAPATSCPRPCRLRAACDRGSGTKELQRRTSPGTKSASAPVPACPHLGDGTCPSWRLLILPVPGSALPPSQHREGPGQFCSVHHPQGWDECPFGLDQSNGCAGTGPGEKCCQGPGGVCQLLALFVLVLGLWQPPCSTRTPHLGWKFALGSGPALRVYLGPGTD